MAGVSTKEIKNRIRSMQSTKQITRAMEMVAASKLRRAQAQAEAARPYFEIMYSVMQDISRRNRDAALPYFAPQNAQGDRRVYILIAGDRGLAGGYNANVFKLCQRSAANCDARILPIGKKALEFARSRSLPIFSEVYAEAAAISVSDCFTIAKTLCTAYLRGEFDEVHLIYTQFESVLTQTPHDRSLLPLQLQTETDGAPASDVLYEPDSTQVFKAVVPEYLGGMLFSAVCASRASEQAARRTAMDSATQNAEEMIDALNLKYNQARQAAITQEITEIVAGV